MRQQSFGIEYCGARNQSERSHNLVQRWPETPAFADYFPSQRYSEIEALPVFLS